ncbi:MAG: OmpH family outer membrane protein [Candidatus Aminicenantes bacterium]|nr:MAG: OmpH family outer membrane protein [Candidatus Aminicenantes bacterium]
MKMRRAINILLFIFLLTVFFSQGFSQQSYKVAVINSQKTVEESAEGKRAYAQLKERNDKIKADIARLDDEIRNLETKYNTQRLTMSDDALIQLTSDLERKRTDRKRYEEDSARDFQRLQLNLTQKIREEVIPIINQVAKEKGFDMVLDVVASGVVYFNPAVDITNEVIRRYDASKAPKK